MADDRADLAVAPPEQASPLGNGSGQDQQGSDRRTAPYSAEQIESLFVTSIDEWNEHSDRGRQKADGRIGISDIGHCRQAAVFMTTETEPTDSPDKTKAFIGTALDALAKVAVAATLQRAGWWVDINRTVMVTLPSGASYPGHPDILIPNMVWEVKTVDGLGQVIRSGPNERQHFQGHGYAGSLVETGEFDEDCWIAWVWIDRSGRYSRPHVVVEKYDSLWLNKADEWVSDVIYAVRHGEEASKDRPIDWCQSSCEWFSACRIGDLGQGGLIQDPETLAIVEDLLKAKADKAVAEKAEEDAKRALFGVEGSTGSHYVKWTWVNESTVGPYLKRGYQKLNVREIPTAMPQRRKR